MDYKDQSLLNEAMEVLMENSAPSLIEKSLPQRADRVGITITSVSYDGDEDYGILDIKSDYGDFNLELTTDTGLVALDDIVRKASGKLDEDVFTLFAMHVKRSKTIDEKLKKLTKALDSIDKAVKLNKGLTGPHVYDQLVSVYGNVEIALNDTKLVKKVISKY